MSGADGQRRADLTEEERPMRVMLATDGSSSARTAAEWLAHFPLPPATTVVVLAVANVPPVAFMSPPLRLWGEEIVAALRRGAEDAIDTLRTRWPTAELRVPEGDPRVAVPEHADEWHADLLVVGARGLGAVRGFMLGSVSTAAIHAADCPVLVVKGAARDLRRVLIAIDGSEDAVAAARFVARLPLPSATVVQLVGVVSPPQYPLMSPELGTPLLFDAMDQLLTERRRAAAEAIAAVRPEFGDRVTVQSTMPEGLPADEILRTAHERSADLVVVGARGLGPVKRLLLGGVAERVLHRADCPVLVVKWGRTLLTPPARSVSRRSETRLRR
jgi:nucleotide-binding universal stress UspA family protein